MQGPQIDLEDPDRMGWWRWWRTHWLARLRLSEHAVCVMSRNEGVADYHDYPDSEAGVPDHFVLLRCKRCGKDFIM